jgi:3-deoxy-manno-octulosonate cytidylyltransferase (CMP-KDO synthetase)
VSTANYWILIPARRASSRLPDKPLALIGGRPLILWAVEQARKSNAQRVVVATDDSEIEAVCTDAGVEVVLTRSDHPSGTDRLAEAAARLGASDEQIVVNLQGDEPLMPPDALEAVANALQEDPLASVATAVTPLSDEELLLPQVVKAVVGTSGRAIYFSRAPIPFWRDRWGSISQLHSELQSGATSESAKVLTAAAPAGLFRHLGLYAFRAGPLQAFTQWGSSPIESTEQLEQLRWLDHGHCITTIALAKPPPAGVDTPEDLERVRRLLS